MKFAKSVVSIATAYSIVFLTAIVYPDIIIFREHIFLFNVLFFPSLLLAAWLFIFREYK